MNFLLSANNNYILPLTVCLTSILENHKDDNLNIYVLQSDLSKDSKNTLEELFNKYNQKLYIINVADHYYDNVPVLRWSKEAYYRLLINELLPKDIDRILYLDCDTVINRDLQGLYDIKMDNKIISALEIKEDIVYGMRESFNLNRYGKYFQSGVMLIDIQKTKDILTYPNTLKIIDILGDKLITVDQDIINIIFDGKINPISEKFNNCNITNFYGKNINRLFNHTSQKDIDDTYIFHYSTGKPWNNLFSGSCEDVWYKYLKLSPYNYLYYNKFNKLKYKIIRSGLIKIVFYEYIKITPILNNLFKKTLKQSYYKKLKKIYRKYIK